MKSALDRLRKAILARHRSIYAFCRAMPELSRSTVYLVLSGRYPGNTGRQITRIETFLTDKVPEPRRIISAQEAFTVLQEAKCAHCRKLDKRGCPECKTQTAREAQALEEYLCARGEV